MGIKISQLPVASTSQDTDIIPIVQAGVTKQIQKSVFNSEIDTAIATIQTEQIEQNTNIQANTNTIQNLENILPKSTATGEDITLNNSANYKFNYFNNGGNTEQDSNLSDGLIEQGAFNNTGETEATNRVRLVNYIKVKNNTKIIVNATSSMDLQCFIGYFNSSKEYIGETGWISLNAEQLISATNLEYIRISFRNTSNTNITPSDISNIIVGPTPSPDYPQKVNNVGSNVNLYNPDLTNVTAVANCSVVVNQKGYYEVSATGTKVYFNEVEGTGTTHLARRGLLQEVKPSTLYTLNVNNEDFNSIYITEYDENEVSLGYVQHTSSNFNFTTKANTKYIVPRFGNQNAVSGTTYTLKVKLEEGLGTGYTPYNRGGIDVKVENKNLFDKNIITDTSYNVKYQPFKVKPNTNYTLSTDSGTSIAAMVFLSTDATNVSTANNGAWLNNPRTINSGNNTIMYIGYRNDLRTYWIQLEQGSTATSYIAHAEQNITIPLPVGMELCKIGQYSDKIFHNIPSNPMYNASLVEGGWYKYNAIRKALFNGGENWSKSGSVSNAYFVQRSEALRINGTTLLSETLIYCDKFYRTSRNNINNIDYGCALSDNQSIMLKNKDISSVADFKTYLISNNVIAYYPLNTPTYTQITDTDTIEALNTLENTKTYQGQTNISSDNIPSPIFDLEYFLIQNSYSEQEEIIGSWFGEPLYRKVIDFGSLPEGGGSKNIATSLDSTTQIKKISGYTTGSSSQKPVLPLPYAEPYTGSIVVKALLINNYYNIYVITRDDYTGYTETKIVIEYTKTNN